MQNNVFFHELQKRAKEQRALMETTLFPSWFGPINFWFATNAFITVLSASWFVSALLFVVFFRWFHLVSMMIVGK